MSGITSQNTLSGIGCQSLYVNCVKTLHSAFRALVPNRFYASRFPYVICNINDPVQDAPDIGTLENVQFALVLKDQDAGPLSLLLLGLLLRGFLPPVRAV